MKRDTIQSYEIDWKEKIINLPEKEFKKTIKTLDKIWKDKDIYEEKPYIRGNYARTHK